MLAKNSEPERGLCSDLANESRSQKMLIWWIQTPILEGVADFVFCANVESRVGLIKVGFAALVLSGGCGTQ
jgi:hypothetical protein